MVVGGSRQETLDPRFVLLGTPQQGVPVILRELVLPDCEAGGTRDRIRRVYCAAVRSVLLYGNETWPAAVNRREVSNKGLNRSDGRRKVGMDDTGYEDIMRRHGLGERNENEKMVIGSTIFPHKPIHQATWTSLDHTTQAQAEYTEVNKQVKRSIKTHEREYMGDLAMTAEKAAREGNMRQLYDITKKLAGNYRKPERPVKSKEGKVITRIEE
ncbi:unnamed protein product [Schistosoma curassoni]|uniref:Reverse transcriptase domain-containing protein n=1 Tax=Schistosoma curassoni TaxID=6186 RepID=A0A183K2U2_9TREM|nr:unnamed protein product [Schistosoma curassoni]